MQGPASERCVGLMKKIGVAAMREVLKLENSWSIRCQHKETPNNGQLTQQWIIGVFLVGHLRPPPQTHSSLKHSPTVEFLDVGHVGHPRPGHDHLLRQLHHLAVIQDLALHRV